MSRTLNLRPGPDDDLIKDDVEILNPGAYAGDRELFILIHGFNRSEKAARCSYERFEKRLRAATTPGREYLLGHFWQVQWPGDHPTPGVSKPTYPVRVPVAKLAGERLNKFLRERAEGRTVCIIAHSLGCRVALQAIKDLQDAGIQAVFLMAAAVPVKHCRGKGPFAERLSNGAEHVFYSGSDGVLKNAFKWGQYGVSPDEAGEPVGRHGNPERERWTTRCDTKLDHGDYWDAKLVAEEIAGRLGLRLYHEIPAHSLPEHPLPRSDRRSFVSRIAKRLLPGQC